MSVKEENILTYSKMTDPVTTNTRNFNGLQEPKKMCVFFLKGQCTRGSSCKFSHNIRDSMTNLETTQPLTQKQITINEIEDAIRFGNLNEIFRKMLTTEEDYIKYYFELHMKFRGIAVMNLKGECRGYKVSQYYRNDEMNTITIQIIGDKLNGYVKFIGQDSVKVSLPQDDHLITWEAGL